VSNPAPKIAHLNLVKSFYGGERQTLLLMQQLGQRGWSQRLVARNVSELADRAGASAIPGLEIVRVGSNPLQWIAATRGCQLTHAHEGRAVYAGLLAHWFHGAATVITRRVPNPLKRSWFRDRAYRAAGAIATTSNAIGESLHDRYPELETITIHSARADLPVDARVAADIRERYAGKVLIAHVGAYRQRAKGQLTIIDVARRAAGEGRNWHFLLMGSGEDEPLFREAIGDLDNIELLGFIVNLGDYLTASDLFILPSLLEGLGGTLTDALHFGLPIVATRVGGIPELVQDGVNGILIDPDSPEQLHAGIARLAQPSAFVEAMQQANRERAERFTAQHMANRYEALYRELL
jgi:glycosyltransferase involved in cell wall biosynthesis